jgi:hypothetical protein
MRITGMLCVPDAEVPEYILMKMEAEQHEPCPAAVIA